MDALLEADAARRAAVATADTLRAEQKPLGKQVGKASPARSAPALLARGKELAAEVKAAEARAGRGRRVRRRSHAHGCPNVVQEGAPAGGEDDYIVLETVGSRTRIRLRPRRTTWSSANRSGDRHGARRQGVRARFYFLTGYGALLQLGLLQLAAQRATANGFT